MSIVRDLELTKSGFGFTDEYGQDKDLTRIADRIIRAVTPMNKKAWVPLVQGQHVEITPDIVERIKADADVLHILPDSVTFKGYEPKYGYTDGYYTQNVGAIDGNMLILNLGQEFTKDKLAALMDKADTAVEESKIEDARRKYEQEQVQKFVDGRMKQRKLEMERDCDAAREQLKHASNQVIFLSRRIEELSRMILAFSESADDESKVRDEIAELFSYEKLKSVRFDENKITFITKELGITDDGGKYHPIGMFEVDLKMDDSSVTVRNTHNYLPKDSGRNIPHPHCSSEGKPCLGNIQTVVPELIAAYDVLGLWQVILSFLTSYNGNDSWGVQLQYWPAYDEEGGFLGTEIPLNKKATKKDVKKKAWHCDVCHTMHFEDDRKELVCPVCGDHFCEEGGVQYNGLNICSTACVSAKKASEGAE